MPSESESPAGKPSVERNLGPQRLDVLMTEQGLSNHDLVLAVAIPGSLTHKAVQRARKGRRLTKPMQQRVAEAFNQAVARKGSAGERVWRVPDLFNY